MKVAIVGSRSYPALHKVRTYVTHLPEETCIVSGGARGVDRMAYDTAVDSGRPYLIFEADWEKFGNSAGYIRNVDIVRNADKVVAFWDGESKGTRHTIEQALIQHKHLEVFFP